MYRSALGNEMGFPGTRWFREREQRSWTSKFLGRDSGFLASVFHLLLSPARMLPSSWTAISLPLSTHSYLSAFAPAIPSAWSLFHTSLYGGFPLII